ncbi:MAG: hypothetical protein Q8891_06775 [Bacteroidota bacterium]|nr:hypothetical protein [Bacteroidota bacterium]
MRKKYTEDITSILLIVIVVIGVPLFVYFTFFTSDDFQNTVISKIAFAISKFAVLPVAVLLIICYCLNITKEDFTKGDKSFTVWVKMGMSLFILLFIPAIPSWGIRSITFLVFSFLAFLKISKGEKAYARAFLFYAILFNPFIRIIFLIPYKFAYSFISASLLIWGISDLIYYHINNKK